MNKEKNTLNRIGVSGTYAPQLLDLTNQDDLLVYESLLQGACPPCVNDNFTGQVSELLKARSIGKPLSREGLDEALSAYSQGASWRDLGIWAYYPWLHQLIHILPKSEFIELRTNRNKNKITQDEQELLATKTVGIVGLSVGRSVALTIAQERIAGEIRLADFDEIELSNLNRIRSGLDTLGVNKAVAAAREISLIDPYLRLRVFTNGLREENMEQFFLAHGKLDLLVEECDTVQVKIASRIKAKSLGIPVVMDTSDRGMIDVERFDLEPDRPLLHGWIDHLDLTKLSDDMSNEDKIPFLAPMLGIKNVSSRLKASVLEVGHSLHTWPQLATSVSLGGAVTANVSRRIFLNTFTQSGRWYVDLENLLGEKTITREKSTSEERSSELLNAALHDLTDLADSDFFSAEDLKKILSAGAEAPSAGNMQPWQFALTGQTIHLIHDLSKTASFFDQDHMIADLGLGACIENILTCAGSMGVALNVIYFPTESQQVIASLYPTSTLTEKLTTSSMIGKRVTDRSIRKRRILSPRERNLLLDVPEVDGCRIKFFGDDIRLKTLASVTGRAERLRVLNRIAHRELFEHELRWNKTNEDVLEGLDISTLGLNDSQLVGMQLARDPQAIAYLKSWNAGSLFQKSSSHAIMSSCGLLLVSAKGRSRVDRLKAGMMLEKAWLHANSLGFAVHPVSAAVFLSQHNETSLGLGLDDDEKKQLQEIGQHLNRVLELGVNEYPQFLMRISDGGAPTKQSKRRPLKNSMFKVQTAAIKHD